MEKLKLNVIGTAIFIKKNKSVFFKKMADSEGKVWVSSECIEDALNYKRGSSILLQNVLRTVKTKGKIRNAIVSFKFGENLPILVSDPKSIRDLYITGTIKEKELEERFMEFIEEKILKQKEVTSNG